MKKLSILLLSALALGITTISCTKDDAKPSIVAKWTYDTYTYTKAGTTTPAAPVNDASCTVKNYLDIRNANVVELQTIDNTDTANPCAVTKLNGTYTNQNSVLHIVVNGQTADYPIVSITSNKLTIKSVNPNDTTEYLTITLTK